MLVFRWFDYQYFVLILVLQDKIIDGHLLHQLPLYTMTVNRVPTLTKFANNSRNVEKTLSNIKQYQFSQYPYLVLVERWERGMAIFCGGSILTPRIVLTSGQCISETSIKEVDVFGVIYYVRAGITPPWSIGEIKAVAKAIRHPEFMNELYFPSKDIGLLQLVEPFRYSPYIQEILLADEYDRTFTHGWGTMVGWGQTPINLSIPSIETCQKQFQNFSARVDFYNDEPVELIISQLITQDVFCTISPSPLLCFVNPGGPFIINSKLYGITSWGRNCRDTVFTRVTDPEIRNWIIETVKANL